MNTFKTSKITTRRQYRYFQGLQANLGDQEKAPWTDYTRSEIAQLLEEADYDSLPERWGYPDAVPRPKAWDPRPCACGCGRQFVPNNPSRRYHPTCSKCWDTGDWFEKDGVTMFRSRFAVA